MAVCDICWFVNLKVIWLKNKRKITKFNLAIRLFFDKRYASTELVNPDFITISKGYRIESKRVEKRDELNQSVKEMLDYNGPYLLEVCVNKEENVFPMIPSGSSVSDIRLE